MSKKPWIKFYPSDWQSEATLKRVSRAARSLWLDIMLLIHQGGDGRLQFNGDNPSDRDLAAVLGDDPRTIRKLLAELEGAGVFSRDEQGFIVSRIFKDWDWCCRYDDQRPAISASIREAVWQRDGERCAYCGTTDGPFHLDHILPWSRGGDHSIENLTVACADCNLSKRDMLVCEWVEARQ